MSLKSYLTCKHCSKIFKKPISLPCGHSLCQEHLIESNHSIKCITCDKEFILNQDMFALNHVVNDLINDEMFLSENERNLKAKIQNSFVKLNKLNNELDETQQTFRNFEMEFYEHFQEIRRQIDLHREEEQFLLNKEKIDSIALDMIYKTIEFQRPYFQRLNKIVVEFLQFKIIQINIEDESKQLNETFRDPNLSLDSINKMNKEQNMKTSTTETTLHEMIDVRAHLQANRFEPFDGDIVFGILDLTKSCLSTSLILSNQQSIGLIHLCEFNSNDKFKLLYRASKHGFDANDFHSKCDGHANTLTILKANESSFIFGGFTSIAWDVSGQWKSDPNAFLFSLTNKDKKPCKM